MSVYKSTNGGISWSQAEVGMGRLPTLSLAFWGTTLYAVSRECYDEVTIFAVERDVSNKDGIVYRISDGSVLFYAVLQTLPSNQAILIPLIRKL